MKWEKCVLLNQSEIGKDELNNSVYELKEVKTTICRFTPWTNEDIEIEDREVTKNERRYAIPMCFSSFPKCTHASIGDVIYEIKEVVDLSPRYVSIRAKAYET